MARRPDPANKFIDAAMKLAAARPWREVALSDVAQEAGTPMSDLYRQFGDKTAILLGYVRRVDEMVLSEDRSENAELSARDRLFDVVMGRLEILGRDKAALKSIAADLSRDPFAMLRLECALQRTGRWMLGAADIGRDGLRGHIRTQGLLAIMLTLLPVWFRDDTDDLSKTMKALDLRLARTERLANFLNQPFQSQPAAS